MIRIPPDTEPVAHHPVYKPIGVRKRVITREDVLNDQCREPDPALYERDFFSDTWVLKEMST